MPVARTGQENDMTDAETQVEEEAAEAPDPSAELTLTPRAREMLDIAMAWRESGE